MTAVTSAIMGNDDYGDAVDDDDDDDENDEG